MANALRRRMAQETVRVRPLLHQYLVQASAVLRPDGGGKLMQFFTRLMELISRRQQGGNLSQPSAGVWRSSFASGMAEYRAGSRPRPAQCG